MRLLVQLLLARLTRQKIRLSFILLAITASCSLVVWTICGYQSLYSPAQTEKRDHLNGYDLVVSCDLGALRSSLSLFGGGPAGGSALSEGGMSGGLNPEAGNGLLANFLAGEDGRIELAKLPEQIPAPLLVALRAADANGDQFIDPEEMTKMVERFAPILAGLSDQAGLPAAVIEEIRNDPAVTRCDETLSGRAFVFHRAKPESTDNVDEGETANTQEDAPAEIPTTEPSEPIDDLEEVPSVEATTVSQNENDEDDSWVDELTEGDSSAWRNSDAPEAPAQAPADVDPGLYQEGFAAFRKVWGTDRERGTPVIGTTVTAPMQKIEGRWLQQGSDSREAVLTMGDSRFPNAKVGDDLLIMAPTGPVQMTVVGLIDNPLVRGIYVPGAFSARLIGERPESHSLALKLTGPPEDFKKKWQPQLQSKAPLATIRTNEDLQTQRLEELEQRQRIFKNQAVGGTVLAVLTSVFIIFTALNVSVNEQRRSIALLRMVGLTRGQIGMMILLEALFLAIPSWLGGLWIGRYLVLYYTKQWFPLTFDLARLSFLCIVVGAIVAALFPLIQSARVKPLEAIGEPDKGLPLRQDSPHRKWLLMTLAVVGTLCLLGDWLIVNYLTIAADRRALLHSGTGTVLLVSGALLLLPMIVEVMGCLFVPPVSFVLRINQSLLRSEIRANFGRTVAMAAILTLSGGLFVSMQVFGYSILQLIMPNRGMPARLAVFWPDGFTVDQLPVASRLPDIRTHEFQASMARQVALDPAGSTIFGRNDPQFANIIMLGFEPEAFEGYRPLMGVRFLHGNRDEALVAMKTGRGAIVTDSIPLLYKKGLNETLKVVHPTDSTKLLEYPIVGVISFPGWHPLISSSGLLRRYRHSGGLAFVNRSTLQQDMQLEHYDALWFNVNRLASRKELEREFELFFDKLRQAEAAEVVPEDASLPPTRFVRVMAREVLQEKIQKEADKIIWGLSKMPLITLTITSIALMGVVTNSVRSRRWQFGIMRAVGISRSGIVRTILIETVFLGLVASMTSFLFGIFASDGALKLVENVFGTDSPPLLIPWPALLYGLGCMLGLCLVAALIPALVTGLKTPLQLIQEGRGSN